LVILWSVRTKKKKKRAAIIKKNLAMANGEKLEILIGQIRATIPKTRVVVITAEPIRLPKTNQSWPFLAACRVKEASGKVVPKPIIKIPIKLMGKLKYSAKKIADLTIPWAAKINNKTEPKTKIRFLKKNLKLNGSKIPS